MSSRSGGMYLMVSTHSIRGPRKPISRPERLVQKACIQVLERCVPPAEKGGPAWTAINPAPSKMSKALAGINKSMGLRPGWMDLLMIFNGKAILVEFKAKGGKMSAVQTKVSDQIIWAGGIVHRCYSLDEFVAILDFHGIPCKIYRR